MSSYTGNAAKTARDVILTDPSTYYQWYENVKGSVPNQFWEYFDPESDAEAIKPIKPIKPVNTPPTVLETSGPSTRNFRAATETPKQQATRRHKAMGEIYGLQDEAARLSSFNGITAKVRPPGDKSLREWITGLRDSTQPPKATVKQTIRVEYGKFMNHGLTDWSTGGPSSRIAK
ncbi:hypothetical protein MMC22_010571 [Lobaria immixta]|nr:hypothetical protein [Lobaria immixta]